MTVYIIAVNLSVMMETWEFLHLEFEAANRQSKWLSILNSSYVELLPILTNDQKLLVLWKFDSPIQFWMHQCK
jgi:hypothetical protein